MSFRTAHSDTRSVIWGSTTPRRWPDPFIDSRPQNGLWKRYLHSTRSLVIQNTVNGKGVKSTIADQMMPCIRVPEWNALHKRPTSGHGSALDDKADCAS